MSKESARLAWVVMGGTITALYVWGTFKTLQFVKVFYNSGNDEDKVEEA